QCRSVEVEDRQKMRSVNSAAKFNGKETLAMAALQVFGQALFRREDARGGPFGPLHHGLHALDQGAATRRHLQFGKVADGVKDSIGQRLLLPEKMKDRMLDAVLGDEMDD